MASTSENDSELTMCDVLEEEQELEDDANAVLGGSDDTNCSYDQGYVPRQALYACKTCCPDSEAGVCLACCLSCHDKHDVVELYTKRNFRCDCGNSKFNGKKCSLVPNKNPLNEDNKYNHNFRGVYCTCRRPYPDLEDNTPDEMIQCIVCEDWYHGRHLGCSVPEEYSEMICQACMDSHEFLRSYQSSYNIQVDISPSKMKLRSSNGSVDKKENDSTSKVEDTKDEPLNSEAGNGDSIVSPPKKICDESEDVCNKEVSLATENMPNKGSSKTDLVKDDHKDNTSNGSVTDIKKIEPDASETKESIKQDTTNISDGISVKEENSDSPSCSYLQETQSTRLIKMENNGTQCIFKLLNNPSTSTGSAFWPEKWREDLCHCFACLLMYASEGCSYLTNQDDTIHAYENRGKTKSKSQYDEGMSALSQLDRVKQMEAVQAYTSLKGELLKYLKGFADNKKTVCEGDIKEFFERMAKKKKLNNGVPHYCR